MMTPIALYFEATGEEQKIESETNKILGALKNGVVESHPVTISAAVYPELGRTATAVAIQRQLAHVLLVTDDDRQALVHFLRPENPDVRHRSERPGGAPDLHRRTTA